MPFENPTRSQPADAAQSIDSSPAAGSINNNSEFLQQEAFLIARDLKAGNTQAALKEVESLRAGSPTDNFNGLLTALNQDVKADLKALGFPEADQIAFSDPDDGNDFGGGSHSLTLNSADGRRTAYFDYQGKEKALDFDAKADLSQTSTQFDTNTGLPLSKTVIVPDGPETDYQYDKYGRVKAEEQLEHGERKIINPATGKETIVSRTENFFHDLIEDSFNIDL